MFPCNYPTSAQHLSNICPTSAKYLPTTCPTSAQSLPINYPTSAHHLPNLSNKGPTSAQHLSDLNPAFVHHLSNQPSICSSVEELTSSATSVNQRGIKSSSTLRARWRRSQCDRTGLKADVQWPATNTLVIFTPPRHGDPNGHKAAVIAPDTRQQCV